MRYLTLVLAMLVLAGPALAARPDARKMTCHQARAMVQNRGAVVMTTGRFTYQRFVAHAGYCDYWERAVRAWTKTRDNPRCLIGNICEERMDPFPFRFR